MSTTLLLLLMVLGEAIMILVCLKGMNDFSKTINVQNKEKRELADQITLLKQQLKIASKQTTAEEAYNGFRNANKEK